MNMEMCKAISLATPSYAQCLYAVVYGRNFHPHFGKTARVAVFPKSPEKDRSNP